MKNQNDLESTGKYRQESGSDFADGEIHTMVPRSAPKTYRRLFLYLLFGIVCFVATIFSYNVWSKSMAVEQCGTTPQEARANGCLFEMTGFSWLPKDCTDPTIEAEFLKSKDLQYYRDANYTEEVPLEEVKRGDGLGFYVRQDYHLAHCAFLFKKLHKAINERRKIDGLISPLGHTAHCVHMLLGGEGARKNAIQFAFTKFPYCGKSGGFNVDWNNLGQWIN